MKGFSPPKPTGSNEFMAFCQAVWEKLWGAESAINNSATVRARKTSKGVFFDAAPGGPSFSLQAYAFQSMEDDYLICRSWDGTHLGTVDIPIAKPPELQFSIVSESIQGEDWEYSGYDLAQQKRHATGPAKQEDQYIAPEYLKLTPGSGFAGTIVYAEPARTFVKDKNDQPIELIDANIGSRAWTADPDSIQDV